MQTGDEGWGDAGTRDESNGRKLDEAGYMQSESNSREECWERCLRMCLLNGNSYKCTEI